MTCLHARPSPKHTSLVDPQANLVRGMGMGRDSWDAGLPGPGVQSKWAPILHRAAQWPPPASSPSFPVLTYFLVPAHGLPRPLLALPRGARMDLLGARPAHLSNMECMLRRHIIRPLCRAALLLPALAANTCLRTARLLEDTMIWDRPGQHRAQ